MARELRALRGATTLETDTAQNMCERVGELLNELRAQNSFEESDIVSVFFSATPDIKSTFPAAAARSECDWLENVALFSSQELAVETDEPLCIRVLIHFHGEQKNLTPIYLHRAKTLRSANSINGPTTQ